MPILVAHLLDKEIFCRSQNNDSIDENDVFDYKCFDTNFW